MNSSRSRRGGGGGAGKQFVSAGHLVTQNRPLIVMPQSKQEQQNQQLQQQQNQKLQQQKQQQQQQLQQQQQQQQQLQQQQQQQQKLQQQQLQQQQQQLQQNPNLLTVSPDVKHIPVLVGSAQNIYTTENGNQNGTDDINMSEEGTKKQSIFRQFLNRKKASVRAKERKLRQNKRLRKVLIPKNALMALHELKGIKISDFNVIVKPGGGFISNVTVNNIQYEGFGTSKTSAKSDACEKALRDLFISKMLQKPLSKVSSVEKMETVGNEKDDIEMKAESGDEDEVPMTNLASFALYKLFSEWENEGFEIPEFRSSSVSNPNNIVVPVQGEAKKPTIRNDLPQNWQSIHPAMLLCMMRPGTSYVDLGTEGTLTNIMQRVGITIDGKEFIGVGRSKKSARKDAAINACNQLFGTNFPKNGPLIV